MGTSKLSRSLLITDVYCYQMAAPVLCYVSRERNFSMFYQTCTLDFQTNLVFWSFLNKRLLLEAAVEWFDNRASGILAFLLLHPKVNSRREDCFGMRTS